MTSTDPKSDPLRNLIHDIRTPLNAVMGLVTILGRTDPLSDKQREFISTLKTSTDDLNRLLAQLFTMIKPQPPRRVLLVEDYEPNILVAGELLNRLNIPFDVAHDGAEAVSKSAATPYTAVLMDLQMPGMDGLQATRAIRQREKAAGPAAPRIPIIAVTAHATSDDRELCLRAGMDDYISKPFRGEELEAKLKRFSA